MELGTHGHMTDEQVEQYSMGAMSEDESALAEQHLLICGTCQHRVTKADEYVHAMGAAAKNLRVESRERMWQRLVFARLTPAFAAVMLLVVAAVVGLRIAGPGAAAPAVIVNLEATRGAVATAHAPAGRKLILNLDIAGVQPESSYALTAVDESGRTLWKKAAQARNGKATASVPSMEPGACFVRLYSPSGELLREYGLNVSR